MTQDHLSIQRCGGMSARGGRDGGARCETEEEGDVISKICSNGTDETVSDRMLSYGRPACVEESEARART
jgi:hypothetical protein